MPQYYRHGYYGYYDDVGNFVKCGRMPKVIGIKVNTDTGKSKFVLQVLYMGRYHEIEIPREDVISRLKLLQYAAYGLDVQERTAVYLINALLEIESKISDKDVMYVHNNLGWYTEENQLLFKKYETPYHNTITSYIGQLLIQPQGSWDEYEAMLKKHVLKSPQLTFAFICGLSAAINGLSEYFCDGETIIVHFSGGSSTGKTTAVMLAISTAGEPNLAKSSLLQSWCATENAILGSVVGNFGFPIAFDEASAINLRDFSKIVYNLCSGKEKARLNQDYNLVSQRGFRTTILSTGEKSLLANCNGNGGLNVRVIEVDNVQLTQSAEEAEEIKDICQYNSGIALDIFSDYLMDKLNNKPNFFDKILKIHRNYREQFMQKCQQNQFTSRLAKKYALFMLTAKLAKSALKIEIDLDALFDFIVSIDEANNNTYSRDLADEFMEKLLSLIAKDSSKFTKTTHPSVGSKIYGRLEYSKGKALNKIIIPAEDFKYIVRHLFKFEDAGVIATALKAKGLLLPEDDKHDTRKMVVNAASGAVRCYVILPPVTVDKPIVDEPSCDEKTPHDDGYHDFDDLP